MKNIIEKNKILFVTIAIVLVCGACLTAVLISQIGIALAAENIQTAEAEAAEAVEEPATDPSPEEAEPPTVNSTLNANALSSLVRHKEMRRGFVIPSLDEMINEADTWTEVEPANYQALKEKALPIAAGFAKAFFNYDMADSAQYFFYYTDTSGHRGDFIKINTTDEAVVCVLAADTLELIEIDYNFLLDSEQAAGNFDFDKIPDSDRAIAKSIAAVFDTSVSDMHPTGGGGGHGIWVNTYGLKMGNGKLLRFAVMNGTLYAIGVYPSEASMNEFVYFDADVQRVSSGIVKPAAPQDFKKGEPGSDDMTQEEAQTIYQTFLSLANGDGQYAKPQMTFYIDHSGVRENYWQLKGDKLSMDISSKSKWIISLTCDELWSPAFDLTQIAYDNMGGKEYADYVANIMSGIYGDGFKNTSSNAVYDLHYCTEDALMTDGSLYEFMFKDGKLQEVMFFANEYIFRYGQNGWKADNEYINTTTGEKFIPR